MDDAGFFKAFNATTLSTMKTARSKAKRALEAWENAVQAKGDTVGDFEEKRQKLEKELSIARMQTSKWSLLSFVLNPEIQAFTKQGESLRQTLKAVWVLNSGNVEVLEYLGDELTKKAKDFVFV